MNVARIVIENIISSEETGYPAIVKSLTRDDNCYRRPVRLRARNRAKPHVSRWSWWSHTSSRKPARLGLLQISRSSARFYVKKIG
jgi:hypothetical protein